MMYRKPDEKPEEGVKADMMGALNEFSNEAFLRVKLMETYISTQYMEYGKIAISEAGR